jgi:hypothetical protein
MMSIIGTYDPPSPIPMKTTIVDGGYNASHSVQVQIPIDFDRRGLSIRDSHHHQQ